MQSTHLIYDEYCIQHIHHQIAKPKDTFHIEA